VLNTTVTALNTIVLEQFPGKGCYYNSVNSCNVNNKSRELDEILVEVLQNIYLPSLPPSSLHFKLGCPVILLWNLCLQEGHDSTLKGRKTSNERGKKIEQECLTLLQQPKYPRSFTIAFQVAIAFLSVSIYYLLWAQIPLSFKNGKGTSLSSILRYDLSVQSIQHHPLEANTYFSTGGYAHYLTSTQPSRI
jgi:hypothetical protein